MWGSSEPGPCDPAATRSSSRLKDVPGKDKKGSASPEAVAAPEPTKTPAPAPTKPPSLREILATRAVRFKAKHYGGEASGAGLETEGLALMRRLCTGLTGAGPQQLQELLDALAGGSSSISVFELLGSGAVKQLLAFLEGEDLRQAAVAGGEGWERPLLKRLERFVEVALPPGSGSSPALAALVRKLQAALSSLEVFPVLAARFGPPGGGVPSSRLGSLSSMMASRYGGGRGIGGAGQASAAGSLNSGLAMLTQPLKLRLSRHAAEKQLREYSSNVVMIEPLASMTAIEDFLYPRVLRAASGSPEAATAASLADGAAAAAASASAAASALRQAEAALRVAEAAAAASKEKAAAAVAAASKAQPIPPDEGAVGSAVEQGGYRGGSGGREEAAGSSGSQA